MNESLALAEAHAKIALLTQVLKRACDELGHTGWNDDVCLQTTIHDCMRTCEQGALRSMLKDQARHASMLCSDAAERRAIRNIKLVIDHE